jgi:RNA polymerase sigma factor (sigma-70 family)
MMGSVTVDRIEAMYRREHDRLWRSLVAYTGDTDLASDAEAEAFAQLIGRGDAVNDPAAWVWRSAYRIAAGLLQRSGSGRSAPEVVVIDDPSIVDLLALLDGLSSQQRACVVLRYVGRFTAPEIAELLGTTAGTVRVQLHRAHESLRVTLEDT